MTTDASGVRRRHLLVGGVAAGVGLAAGVGVDRAALALTPPPPEPAFAGAETVAFHGRHQAGIETPAQAHAVFLALDLRTETDRAAIERMLRVLTADAETLTGGQAALADTEPELAESPSRLTVTFGFGPELVARTGAPAPTWLRPLPAFGIDRLDDAWSHGDLLLHLGSDDPVALAHAQRMLLKDSRSFATLRWAQPGFRRARGSEAPGTTMRNLFGQVDGTANPVPGTRDFDELVWRRADNPGWLEGGTGMVLRRIEMDLDEWDLLDRAGREKAVGRRLADGAPTTGGSEHTEPDFQAKDALGLPVIPAFAHIRRARSENTAERIHRRGYNYDERPADGSVSRSGLLFASYQADVDAQFVPLQERLDRLDLLNKWTTPIGSAVFALPPGCAPGGFVGEALFELGPALPSPAENALNAFSESTQS